MSDAKQNLPLPEGACSVTCPSCHLTIVHEKPRPLPPDAVSGAATPARQRKCGHPKSKHLPEPWGAACMHNGGECQCAEYVEPGATPEAQCKCKCVFCFEGHHHRCVRGCDWIPFPAATPEAQIPECVQAPELCPFCGNQPLTGEVFHEDETGEKEGYCYVQCGGKCSQSKKGSRFCGVHAEEMADAIALWNERTQLAALRVERDTLRGKRDEYEQCCLDYYALRNERDAMRVERDRALEAAKLLLESHCCDTGEVDYKPEWIDIWTTVCDACRPVRSLARPIPAEKLE